LLYANPEFSRFLLQTAALFPEGLFLFDKNRLALFFKNLVNIKNHDPVGKVIHGTTNQTRYDFLMRPYAGEKYFSLITRTKL
jgi:hypothetical protein